MRTISAPAAAAARMAASTGSRGNIDCEAVSGAHTEPAVSAVGRGSSAGPWLGKRLTSQRKKDSMPCQRVSQAAVTARKNPETADLEPPPRKWVSSNTRRIRTAAVPPAKSIPRTGAPNRSAPSSSPALTRRATAQMTFKAISTGSQSVSPPAEIFPAESRKAHAVHARAPSSRVICVWRRGDAQA